MLSSRASVSPALTHEFPGINTCPQHRHSPALKPCLLGRDKVCNAGWHPALSCDGRQGVSPASWAGVPKQTLFPGSIPGTLSQHGCTYPCYLLLPCRALCCRARHSLTALAPSHRACAHQTLPPVLSSHVPPAQKHRAAARNGQLPPAKPHLSPQSYKQ